jgi:hypothetical protein
MKDGIEAHFDSSPSCGDACMAEAQQGHAEWMEELKMSDPETYEAMLALESLRPVAGNDPLFGYEKGELKSHAAVERPEPK